MRNQNVVDYLWALRHLRNVFQNSHVQAMLTFVAYRELALMNALTQTLHNASCLLCRWHITKNIFAKQRKAFSTLDAWEEFVQAWNGLVAATTIVDYESRLASMHVAFSVVSIRYLDYTWLVYMEKFVSIFVRNKCHCGHVIKSRVKIVHAALKKWISMSTGKVVKF